MTPLGPLGWFGIAILVILLVSILILYFQGVFRNRITPFRAKNIPAPEDPHFPLGIAYLTQSLLTQGEVTGFWLEAEAIQTARLEAIRSAQSTIHFETFFVTPGQRAHDFAAAIAERAQAGVKVLLTVDAYGSKKMSPRYWQRLKAAGVEIRFFNPFNWKAPVDYLSRTHRKLLLIDSKIALVGGAGISDHWDGLAKLGHTAPWFDFEIRYQGAVIAALEGTFFEQWTELEGAADLSAQIFNPNFSGSSTMIVSPGDDPSYRSSSVRSLFHTLISVAQQRLWIASPYFLPDAETRKLLIQTHRNGVDLRILTSGSKSDKQYVYQASCELYGELVAAGIPIYEYQPSMMHAKVLLIDQHWVSAGSANFDPRSYFHNDELNLSSNHAALVSKVEQLFQTGFSHSQRVSLRACLKRPIWKQWLGKLVLFFQWQL